MQLLFSSLRFIMVDEPSTPFPLSSIARREGYRIDAICGHLRCTPRRLHEVFLRDLGIPPKQWLMDERITHARHLLESGQCPAQVSRELAFATPSNFGREFKRATGLPPGQYQARFQSLRPPP